MLPANLIANNREDDDKPVVPRSFPSNALGRKRQRVEAMGRRYVGMDGEKEEDSPWAMGTYLDKDGFPLVHKKKWDERGRLVHDFIDGSYGMKKAPEMLAAEGLMALRRNGGL